MNKRDVSEEPLSLDCEELRYTKSQIISSATEIQVSGLCPAVNSSRDMGSAVRWGLQGARAQWQALTPEGSWRSVWWPWRARLFVFLEKARAQQ